MTNNKITKKGRNPGAVDNWLDTLGLYRKNVAYDETCLFRAVSEQLFDCQVYHERVRKECIEYARENYEEFCNFFDSEDCWMEHLELLEKHMVVCGNVEIYIISRKYNRDVMVFDAARQQMYDITNRNLPESLLLCLMDEDHYDVIYQKEHIVSAGFCQSIIYKLLYEEVFDIQNVDEIVNGMLYDKNNAIITQAEVLAEKKLLDLNKNCPEGTTSTSLDEVIEEEEYLQSAMMTSTNIAPFPFKVAKALDPSIYRNIEYDSWGEVRREMRLGDWYYGDDKLILGTRCVLNDLKRGENFDCYIQEIKDRNKCVVYLTKLAERRTVNYTDLSPENDAKPWPLPYRFSKNLVTGSTPALPLEKQTKSSKKRNKDKRRTKSCSESSAISNTAATSESNDNVNAFVGIPLQMHIPTESNYRNQETNTEVTEEVAPVVQDILVTPEVAGPPPGNRYQWEQPQWHYLPPTPDPFVWPQTPTTPQGMFNYGFKPMVASAPVTPDVIPYHDPNFPYYYNYHVDPYNTYSQWSPHTNEYPTTPQPQEMVETKPQEEGNKPQKHPIQTEMPTYEQPPTHMPERPTLCTTMIPQNPQMEVYSPMIIPPGTPVIYTPDMSEMMMPSAPILYSPSVDMQYVSPGPFVYPPTPPAAWYPAGINSQGFVFPPPMNSAQTFQK